MKRILLPFLLIFLCVFAQTSAIADSGLNILDPRWGWWGLYSGEISEATLVVEPQGIYMKYDLYLTISAENIPVNPNDSLEVEFFFNLPKEAIVCDSWLWIEDYISYGIMMDVDSATKVYEDIVDRRTDPSILYKRSATEYELRIFPITASEPRKVKISYLLPMDWTLSRVLAPLPIIDMLPWLSTSWLDLILVDNPNFQNPRIVEKPSMVFSSHNNSVFGKHFKTRINSTQDQYNFTLGFDSPMNNGVYTSYYSLEQDKGYYDVALLPSEHLTSLPSSKTLILLDYFGTNGDDLRPRIKELLSDHLTSQDSFNLMLNISGNIFSASQTWLPANVHLIDSLFSPSTFNLGTNSKLLELLTDGLQFMEDHNNEGSILLFSNNDWYVTSQSGENFYNTLVGSGGISVPIYIANYQHEHIPVVFDPQKGREFTGNEYLFGILASRSGGSYTDVKDKARSFYLALSQQLLAIKGKFDFIDMDTHTVSDVDYDSQPFNHFFSEPFIYGTVFQTGRYSGNFPLKIDFSSIYQQQFQSFEIEISQAEMVKGNSSTKKAWAGNQIKVKEELAFSPTIREEIVEISISEKILSLYTAFLCLEDAEPQGLQIPPDLGGSNTGVELFGEKSSLNVEAFPNPIKDIVTIQLEHLPQLSLTSLELQVLDIQGKMIHTFDLTKYQLIDGSISFEWNTGKLPSGMYLLTLKGDIEPQVIRLVKE